MVGEIMNFDGQIVYHRIEKLAFKDRGTYFDGTGLYKLLDDWSLHVKHRSVCVKYIEGSALSIQKWKKVYGSDYMRLLNNNVNIDLSQETKLNNVKKNNHTILKPISKKLELSKFYTLYSNAETTLLKTVEKKNKTTSPTVCEKNGGEEIKQNQVEWVNDSYSTLFCRRCYVYDCQKHGISQPQPRFLSFTSTENALPCSGANGYGCYLHDIPTEKQMFKYFKSINLKNEYPDFKNRFHNMSRRRKKSIAVYLQKHIDRSVYQSWLGDDSTQSNKQKIGRILNCKFDRIMDQSIVNNLTDINSNDSKSELPASAAPFIRKVLSTTNGNICQAVKILGKYWNKKEKIGLINCQTLFAFLCNYDLELINPSTDFSYGKNRKMRRRKRKGTKFSQQWSKRNILHQLYQPCDHPGSCTAANGCPCIANNNYCEKYCACSIKCSNRFKGCGCHLKCNTRTCACFAANRECDPDNCNRCIHDGSCLNSHKNRNDKQRIIMGHSSIHGWGAFTPSFIKKGSYVYSYVGELISQNEADRRGKIYDKLKCSFLFNLNDDQVIDATRKGNKLKYANHSHEYANMKPKVVMSNGDHCVQMYAIRNIEPGEELCFDYGYGKDVAPDWAKRGVRKFKHGSSKKHATKEVNEDGDEELSETNGNSSGESLESGSDDDDDKDGSSDSSTSAGSESNISSSSSDDDEDGEDKDDK